MVQGVELLVIRDNQRRLFQGLTLDFRHFTIATCHHDNGFGVLAGDFSHHLAGLAFGGLCHRAGVDDIDIGRRIELGDCETSLLKIVQNTLCLILIDLAAQCRKCGSRHVLLLPCPSIELGIVYPEPPATSNSVSTMAMGIRFAKKEKCAGIGKKGGEH